jgi:hypothetical protein
MSLWEEFDFEARIAGILRDHIGRDHHMGPAFLSPYQIAIEFARLYPSDYVRLEQQGLSLGGEGAGTHNSLPQYIGRELSSRRIAAIEGGFLSSSHMEDLFFHFEGRRIQSSLTRSGYDLSLFRVRPPNSNNTGR